MAALEITWNLGPWGGTGQGRKLDRALVRSLSRAGSDAVRAMKAESSRLIRDRKRFKVAAVNRALPLSFPENRSDIDGLVWRMRVSGKPVPLSAFPFSQTRKGVSVAVNKTSRKLVRGAFVATLTSGHTGIFRRIGKARLPIREAFSTRISDPFSDSGFIPAVYARTEIVFARTYKRLMDSELDRLR